MLYLRLEVLVPSILNVEGFNPASAHMMFASDDVRDCTGQAVRFFRENQFKALQLKEAQMGHVQREFSRDGRVDRLFGQLKDAEMVWELEEGGATQENENEAVELGLLRR